MMNTTTEAEAPLLKTDAVGRVRTPAARREQLLDEFERSGLSGAKFAELTGLKYQTLATWAQARRRRSPAAKPPSAKDPAATVRWLEAVVGRTVQQSAGSAPLLPVQLPGGARLEISCATQIPLAVTLLRALEKFAASC